MENGDNNGDDNSEPFEDIEDEKINEYNGMDPNNYELNSDNENMNAADVINNNNEIQELDINMPDNNANLNDNSEDEQEQEEQLNIQDLDNENKIMLMKKSNILNKKE